MRTKHLANYRDVEAEVPPLAEGLRNTLLKVMEATVGRRARPTQLTRSLGLDKSLASRLVRALEAGSQEEFLHLLPSPAGLRIFLRAAEGTADAELDRAEAAVTNFQTFLESLPGGRSDLEAIMSERFGVVRAGNSKKARQGLFRHSSALLGFQCDELASTLILYPSSDLGFLHGVELQHRVGLRLLQPGAAIGIMRLLLTPSDPSLATIVNADGTPIENSDDTILREFSSSPLPEMRVIQSGREITLVLTREGWGLHSPVTISSNLLMRNAFRVDQPGCRSYVLNLPCRHLVRDVFIHPSVQLARPEFTVEVPRPDGAPVVQESGLLKQVATIGPEPEVTDLGSGLDRAGAQGLPDYQGALRHTFESAGLDASEFRGYRIDVPYPVTFSSTAWWFRESHAK